MTPTRPGHAEREPHGVEFWLIVAAVVVGTTIGALISGAVQVVEAIRAGQ